MTPLRSCWLLVLLPALAAAAAEPARGTLAVPHVSGAAVLRDGRVALVGDGTNAVYLLEGGAARLAGKLTAGANEALAATLHGKVALNDLEDAAAGGPDELFVIGSHARDRFGEAPEARYRLARLRFSATGKLLEAVQSPALLQAIQTEVPFLADAIRRTPARTGLNVEGLAFTPGGHLLIGLRAPTITESTPRPHGGQEDAVVLRIKNPDALFENPAQPPILGETLKLDLHGGGIRGMAYDARLKGVWILSGLSAEPGHPVTAPWRLWFWNEKTPPRPVELLGVDLGQPEAVCPVEVSGKPHLLLIEDGAPASRFTVVSAPAITE